MRKLFVVLILFLTVISCRNDEEPVLSPLTAVEITGERLWQRLTEESDYKVYRQWTGHEGMRPGQSPHGALHEVFANRDIYDALPVDGAEVPYGSIIVKENYRSTKELDKLTVMAKVEGYSPDTNDWFWSVFSPTGEVLAEGSPAGCLSCHGGLVSNDYIIIKNIDEP